MRNYKYIFSRYRSLLTCFCVLLPSVTGMQALADTVTDPAKIKIYPFPMTESGYGGHIGTWDINIYIDSDNNEKDKVMLEGKIIVTSSKYEIPSFPMELELSDFKRDAEEVVVAGKKMTVYKHKIFLPTKTLFYFRPEIESEGSGDFILGLTWRCGEMKTKVLNIFGKECEGKHP